MQKTEYFTNFGQDQNIWLIFSTVRLFMSILRYLSRIHIFKRTRVGVTVSNGRELILLTSFASRHCQFLNFAVNQYAINNLHGVFPLINPPSIFFLQFYLQSILNRCDFVTNQSSIAILCLASYLFDWPKLSLLWGLSEAKLSLSLESGRGWLAGKLMTKFTGCHVIAIKMLDVLTWL